MQSARRHKVSQGVSIKSVLAYFYTKIKLLTDQNTMKDFFPAPKSKIYFLSLYQGIKPLWHPTTEGGIFSQGEKTFSKPNLTTVEFFRSVRGSTLVRNIPNEDFVL